MKTEVQPETAEPNIDDVYHLYLPPDYDIALCGAKPITGELLPPYARPQKICSMCVEIAEAKGIIW